MRNSWQELTLTHIHLCMSSLSLVCALYVHSPPNRDSGSVHAVEFIILKREIYWKGHPDWLKEEIYLKEIALEQNTRAG